MSHSNDLTSIMLQRTSSQSSSSASSTASTTSLPSPLSPMTPTSPTAPTIRVAAPTAQLGPQMPPRPLITAVHVVSLAMDAAILAAVIYGRVQLSCPTSLVVPIVFGYYIIRFSITMALTTYRLFVPSTIEPDPFNMSVSAIVYKYVHFLCRGGMIVGFLAIATMLLIDRPNCNAASDYVLTAVVVYDLTMTVLVFAVLGVMICYFGFNATCIAVCPPAAIVMSMSHTKPAAHTISISALKSLTTVTYQAGMFEPTDRLCAICLNEFAPGDTLRLLTRCAHHFHTSCVDMWLVSRGGNCPICRTPVQSDKHAADNDLIAAIERSVTHSRTGDDHHHTNVNTTATTRRYEDGYDREHDYALQASPPLPHTVVEVADEIEMA